MNNNKRNSATMIQTDSVIEWWLEEAAFATDIMVAKQERLAPDNKQAHRLPSWLCVMADVRRRDVRLLLQTLFTFDN